MERRLVLGQAIPAAGVLSGLYTVPGLTEAVCSTLIVCNQGAATTYRVSVAPAGAVDATYQYIVRDDTLKANESKSFTLGITLSATDVVRVYSVSGSVSFSLFGVQLQ